MFVRNNITVFAVVFLLGCISMINTSFDRNFQVGNSILFTHLDGRGSNDNVISDDIIVRSASNGENSTNGGHVPIVKVASAHQNFTAGQEENYLDDNREADVLTDYSVTVSPILVQGSAFMQIATYYNDSMADFSKYGIVKYKVESGDSPGSIAASFGISTYTVLWANNLKVGDIIKPDQELEILPVSGVKHIVKSTDTIESIANKYKAGQDEVIIYNNLPAVADEVLVEGKILIIPNGEKAAPIKPRPQIRSAGSRIVSSSKYKYTTSGVSASKSRRFPYGYCTWYVASRTYVPWNGHAKSWLTNARAYGFRTDRKSVV